MTVVDGSAHRSVRVLPLWGLRPLVVLWRGSALLVCVLYVYSALLCVLHYYMRSIVCRGLHPVLRVPHRSALLRELCLLSV